MSGGLEQVGGNKFFSGDYMDKYFSEWYNEFISANKRAPTWDDVMLAVEKFTSTNSAMVPCQECSNTNDHLWNKHWVFCPWCGRKVARHQ